jgi:RNA polymerase sigma factor (sigma-70 family)
MTIDPLLIQYRTIANRDGPTSSGALRLRDRVLKKNKLLIWEPVNRINCRVSEREGLERAALWGLSKAIRDFDPSMGYEFSSYAVPVIRGELLHYLRDEFLARTGMKRPDYELNGSINACHRRLLSLYPDADRDIVALSFRTVGRKHAIDLGAFELAMDAYRKDSTACPIDLTLNIRQGEFSLSKERWAHITGLLAASSTSIEDLKHQEVPTTEVPTDWLADSLRWLDCTTYDALEAVYFRRPKHIEIDQQIRIVAKRLRRSEENIRHRLAIALEMIKSRREGDGDRLFA